jgi:hypothetical protein
MVYYLPWFPFGDRIAHSAEGKHSGRLERRILSRGTEREAGRFVQLP